MAVIRRAGSGLVAASAGAAAAGLILGTSPDAGRSLGRLAAVAMVLAAAAGAAAVARAAGRVPDTAGSVPDTVGRVARTAGRLPGAALAGAGAVGAGIGLWLASGGPGDGAWTWGLALTAAGFALALALQRVLIAEVFPAEALRAGLQAEGPHPGLQAERPEVTGPEEAVQADQTLYARFNWYWTALIGGCLCPLVWAMLWSADPGAILRLAGTAAAVGGLLTLLTPAPSPPASPAPVSAPPGSASAPSLSGSTLSAAGSAPPGSASAPSLSGSAPSVLPSAGGAWGISVPDAPWARRSIAAAFGVGALFAGMAASGHALLSGEWQRTPRGAAGVLAATAGGAAVAVIFGRWFHRLDRRRGAARASAAGFQMMVGGLMALLGALSFTYVGLVVSWSMAAGAFALAAVGLDAAAWTGLSPSARRAVAARQVVGFAAGAAVAAALLAGPLAGRHHQVKIAVSALACIEVGRRLSRRCPLAAASGPHRGAWSAAAPRRVGAGVGGPLLELDGVGVAYEGVQAVFDASLTVEEGQVAVLLGANGAGKTTTLRAVSGLEPVCAGRIGFRGLDVTRTPPTWRVGMGLHQIVGGDAVATGLTVEENLRLFSHLVPRATADAGIADALDLFPRLRERLGRRAATLSGGEKQMLALAKALIVAPRLLLIDELSLGLAPALVTELVPVVRQIAARGTSVLLVEQSLNVACDLADRAYVMDKGEIRHRGPVTDPETMADLLRSVYLADDHSGPSNPGPSNPGPSSPGPGGSGPSGSGPSGSGPSGSGPGGFGLPGPDRGAPLDR